MADQDINQLITQLDETASNLRVLVNTYQGQGDYEKALELSDQVVALDAKTNELKAKRRSQLVDSAAWAALNQHMDALNQAAKETGQELQSTMDDVEEVKSLISLVSGLVTKFV